MESSPVQFSLSLAITIIALMCGLVGLFKVATLDPNRPFLAQLGTYTAILIGPLALLGFQLAQSTLGEFSPVKPAPILSTSSEAEIMLAASSGVSNDRQKQAALRATIATAFASKQYHVVIDAARQLTATVEADRVLIKVTTELSIKPKVNPGNPVNPANPE